MVIHNIHDHMAYTHSCGSVHFHLLRSGAIECANCNERLEFTVNHETKTYSDGTTATGRAPLPPRSPRQQEAECPQCYSIEWDRISAERGRERDVPFNRCHHCGNEWEAL